MDKVEKKISFQGTDLSSRSSGSAKRLQIIALLNEYERVCLDFSAVESVSDSYADELFGVLAIERGTEWLFEKVCVSNTKKHVLKNLAAAIHRRLQESAVHPQSRGVRQRA